MTLNNNEIEFLKGIIKDRLRSWGDYVRVMENNPMIGGTDVFETKIKIRQAEELLLKLETQG